MNTLELLQFSLGNAFRILDQVAADVTQEQADWQPPGTALSIGALYWHIFSSTDSMVHQWCLDQAPLSQSAGWEEKVLLSSVPEGEEDHAARMRAARIDLPVMREYAQAVTAATQGWLASLAPEDLERKMETPVGELNLGQLVATFFLWHIDAHCGEISALKGCQGARGYPF